MDEDGGGGGGHHWRNEGEQIESASRPFITRPFRRLISTGASDEERDG